MGHPIELSHSGKGSEGKWLMIRRESSSLRIFPRRDLHYGIVSAFPQEWPAIRFQAVYDLAQGARDDRAGGGLGKGPRSRPRAGAGVMGSILDGPVRTIEMQIPLDPCG